jgi:hypothetical protein
MSQIQHCLVGSFGSQVRASQGVRVPSASGLFTAASNRGSAGSVPMARIPRYAEAAASPQNKMVQGIDASSGSIGDTKKRNSNTKVGKNTHVDTCIELYGGCSPWARRGRSMSAIRFTCTCPCTCTWNDCIRISSRNQSESESETESINARVCIDDVYNGSNTMLSKVEVKKIKLSLLYNSSRCWRNLFDMKTKESTTFLMFTNEARRGEYDARRDARCDDTTTN